MTMINPNAQVLAKLQDPKTPTREYVRLWNEWRDILHRQAVVDAIAAKHPSRLMPAERNK
jgi:hypothetical protein